MGDTDPTWFWAVARASGIAAYVALSLDVLSGLLMSTGLGDRWMPRARSLDIHRFLAVAALSLTAVHAFALLGDRYIDFGLLEVLVPFSSEYRPFAVGLGVIAAWLAWVVHTSFALRRWLGSRAWRWMHYASFLLFVLATAHGLLAGTDARTTGMLLLHAVPATLVLWWALYRVTQAIARARRPA